MVQSTEEIYADLSSERNEIADRHFKLLRWLKSDDALHVSGHARDLLYWQSEAMQSYRDALTARLKLLDGLVAEHRGASK